MPALSRNAGNENPGSIFHKLQYRDMANKFNPFGAPGSGAPNQDIRMRSLAMDGLYPINKNDIRTSTLPNSNRQKHVPHAISGGGGAPIRSSSGKFMISLTEDPDITFSESTRNYVDMDLRYKKSQQEQNFYRNELDQIVDEKRKGKLAERLKESQRPNQDDDGIEWGKPGPGGTPWRDPKDVGCNFMKSMGWTTKETMRSMDSNNRQRQSQQYSPDKLPRANNTEYSNQYQSNKRECGNTINNVRCCEKCSCQCIRQIESTIMRTPPMPSIMPPPQVQNNNNYRLDYERTNKSQPLPPAPNLSPPHYQKPKECHRHDLEQMRQQQAQQQSSSRKNKQKVSPQKMPSRNYMISGGVELVPLLAKRRADERPISLSTTDITKYKINKSSWNDGDGEYLNDLNRQVAQKYKMKQASRDRDRESSNQHFNTLEGWWGRQGCGAPQDHKYKLNLDNLLYNVPMYQMQYQYNN